jgi:hypothetical protein
MSKLLIALFIAAGLGIAGCATQSDTRVAAAKPMAPVAPITKDAYDTAVKNAEMQYKMDKDGCASRSGNAEGHLPREASGKEMIAKANAEAAYKATPKAREDARVARAEATHNVAKEKCDDLSGNAKDVCVKEADAALVKAKADAKVDRVAADTQQESAMKQADARKQAVENKPRCRLQGSPSRCATHRAGPAKNTCSQQRRVLQVRQVLRSMALLAALFGRQR